MTAPRFAPRPSPVEFVIEAGRDEVKSLNSREHFRVKAKRVAALREKASEACGESVAVAPTLPLTVTLTRVYGPRGQELDRWDNLPGSMKPVIDGVCDAIGLDDRDKRLTVAFEQERGDRCAVRVRVESLGNEVIVPRAPKAPRKPRAKTTGAKVAKVPRVAGRGGLGKRGVMIGDLPAHLQQHARDELAKRMGR